jgi:hypothetical protein
LQLSPLWGVAEIEDISPDFPQVGSRYHVKLVEAEQEYDTIVTALVPQQKFAYRLTTKRQVQSTWTVQNTDKGTRLIYLEEFLVDDAGEEEFVQSVRQVVQEWLSNIKRYAELRGDWFKRLARWVADRYILRLKIEQRRVIILLLAWQVITLLAFVALGLGFAVVKLLGLD